MEKQFTNMGNKLARLRKNKKLSQAKLAEACGVHPQFVSNWERGICYPPTHCHKRLAKALGFGPRNRPCFYDDRQRSELWEAITEDFNRIIDEKFKELI